MTQWKLKCEFFTSQDRGWRGRTPEAEHYSHQTHLQGKKPTGCPKSLRTAQSLWLKLKSPTSHKIVSFSLLICPCFICAIWNKDELFQKLFLPQPPPVPECLKKAPHRFKPRAKAVLKHAQMTEEDHGFTAVPWTARIWDPIYTEGERTISDQQVYHEKKTDMYIHTEELKKRELDDRFSVCSPPWSKLWNMHHR